MRGIIRVHPTGFDGFPDLAAAIGEENRPAGSRGQTKSGARKGNRMVINTRLSRQRSPGDTAVQGPQQSGIVSGGHRKVK